MLGIGAFLWLIAKGKTRSAGAILAGFGLLFIGIEYLQTGMEGISWNLDAVGGSGFGWQWILAGIGILMSIVMQSSSAAAATTLVALHAGSLTFHQACAMIVGQSVGTAATSAMVAIGAGLAVRRAALAHIIYNVTVGILGILLLRPLTAAAGWVGAQLDDPKGVLALAAFSSIFKLSGSLAFYPWLDSFSRVHRAGLRKRRRNGRRPSRPGPRRSGRGRRARGRLAGDLGGRARLKRRCPPPARRPVRRLRSADRSISTGRALPGVAVARNTRSERSFEPRLVRLCHALDHLSQLHDDLTRIPPEIERAGSARLALRKAYERSLPGSTPPRTPRRRAIRPSSRQWKTLRNGLPTNARTAATKSCKTSHCNVPLRRRPGTASNCSRWADGAFYHAWRLAESLRIASDRRRTPAHNQSLVREDDR